MLNEYVLSALETLKHPESLDDIFEYLDFFFDLYFHGCPCVFIKENPDLLSNYEVIRMHILRIWQK